MSPPGTVTAESRQERLQRAHDSQQKSNRVSPDGRFWGQTRELLRIVLAF